MEFSALGGSNWFLYKSRILFLALEITLTVTFRKKLGGGDIETVQCDSNYVDFNFKFVELSSP